MRTNPNLENIRRHIQRTKREKCLDSKTFSLQIMTNKLNLFALLQFINEMKSYSKIYKSHLQIEIHTWSYKTTLLLRFTILTILTIPIGSSL